jgi:Ser/Thr protein kinase RdoA (MazF antagonist)
VTQGQWSTSTLGLGRLELFGRLDARCDAIASELTQVSWALPPAVVHGDAHTGNLLQTVDGRRVLCDLDALAWGPPEADLVPAAHGKVRFGRDPHDYARFANRYGFDVLDWSGWPVLRRLRDLQLAAYLLPAIPELPTCGHELAHRVRTVLSDDNDAIWHRYAQFA